MQPATAFEDFAREPGVLIGVCALDDPPPVLSTVNLAPSERRLARGAAGTRRRQEIETTRCLLRLGLHHGLGQCEAPVAWTDRGPEGAGDAAHVGLSIAHSRRFAAAALNVGGGVGVDIECTDRPRSWRRITDTLLCDADRAWITSGGPARFAARRFLAIWTAREAHAKYRRASVLELLSQPLLAVRRRDRHDRSSATRGVGVTVYADRAWIAAICAPTNGAVPNWFLAPPAFARLPVVCFDLLNAHGTSDSD